MKAISKAGFSFALTWCLAAEALGGGPGDYGISSRWTTAVGGSLRPIYRNDDVANHHRKLMSLHEHHPAASVHSGLSLANNDTPTEDHLQQQQHDHRSLAFGDYIDSSFACPAMVTCNIVCVANVTDCPADATCPGMTADGSANNNSNRTYEVRT